jgi:hypothetical protein
MFTGPPNVAWVFGDFRASWAPRSPTHNFAKVFCVFPSEKTFFLETMKQNTFANFYDFALVSTAL